MCQRLRPLSFYYANILAIFYGWIPVLQKIGLGRCSLIVSPHTQNTNRFLFGKDFVHDAVLNIDAA